MADPNVQRLPVSNNPPTGKIVGGFSGWLAAPALALCFGATVAHAEMKTTDVSGYWSAQAGINNGGAPMCMVQTRGTGFDGSPIGMMIKYDFAHPESVAFQLYKGTWNLPSRQRVKVVLQVDNAQGRSFIGNQWLHNNMVDFEIAVDAIDPVTGEKEITFMSNLLRAGNLLRISFPDGNEAPWAAPLEGANAALNSMQSCMRYVADNASGHSQPYSQAPVTQPYTPGQQLPPTQKKETTQPYTPL